MVDITVDEIQRDPAKYLLQVAAGETFLILQADRAIAELVENGQSRKMGFVERVGQIFSNPGSLLNDLLGAIGIPLLRGAFGGNDAQQSRAIQISDLTVKVAEIERIRTEIGAKTRESDAQVYGGLKSWAGKSRFL